MRINKVVATLVATLFLVTMVGTVNAVEMEKYEDSIISVDLPVDSKFLKSWYYCPYGPSHIRLASESCQAYMILYLPTMTVNNKPTSSLEEYVDWRVKKEKVLSGRPEIYDMTTKTGLRAIAVEWSHKIGGEGWESHRKEYYIQKDRSEVCVIVCIPDEDFEQANREFFEPMIQSFRFTSSPKPTPTVIPSLTSTPKVTPTPTPTMPAEDWPMFHHDARHTGYSTSTAPDTNQVLWSYKAGNYVASSPVVADGKVFVYSGDEWYDDRPNPSNKIYALDKDTGEVIWVKSYETGIGALDPSPAVANGKVFVGSTNGKIYALDINNGKQIWSYETSYGKRTPIYTSPTVANGKVFVIFGQGIIYCLDGVTGEAIWSYEIEDSWSSPAVADGKVFVGASYYEKVFALDENTGALIWSYEIGDYGISSPAVGYGKVFVHTGNSVTPLSNDILYALDEDTGELIWSYNTGGSINRLASSPAVANGKVFVGSSNGKIYALDANNGKLIWSYETGDVVLSSPAIADGKVFIGSGDSKVYALDENTGKLIWNYRTGGYVHSSQAIADGKVFVGSMDGKIYCFGSETPVTSTPTPTPTPEPLKLINATLDLAEGKSKSYTVNSNGGSLIVKANGLDEMFLVKNKYTIEILKDGEPFETYSEEFSTLKPVGDPAKVEIVLPPEPAQYTVTVSCDKIGRFLWWSNDEKAQIIVFSSLHTTKSAEAMKASYSKLAYAWDRGGTEAVRFFLTSTAGDPTTFEGIAKLFLPGPASVFLTSLEIISTDYDSIMEKLADETLVWGLDIQPKFHETSVYPDRVWEIRDELIEFYEEIGYDWGIPWFVFSPESYISTQLRVMAYLNFETQQALREERFEDAKFFMEAQKDFTSHLDWLILAEEVSTPMDSIINDKKHSYYELWKLSKSLVECDTDRIRNYFSERTPPQQTGCGNGICEMSEDCNTCPEDCDCPAGEYCSKIGICMPVTCGDEVCSLGEEDTCCEDCGCPEDKICNTLTQTCQEKPAISNEKVMEIVNDYMNKNNIDGTITISDVYYKYETVKQVNINCEIYGIVLFINDKGEIVEEFRTI